jgi:hypothetical protein
MNGICQLLNRNLSGTLLLDQSTHGQHNLVLALTERECRLLRD